ncbi:hypothetical protein D7Y26_07040 [Stenotrophomonas maltophilia]|jgi:hypothetical protein|nr:hypothetical protein [Stenotrophomonas maltophilia]MBA0323372.1 hypothetical protein [Stenotrophomonas maltophilia]
MIMRTTVEAPMHPSDPHSDTDRALLEGLLQLAVEGQTEEQDFQRIGEEVFARLLDTYGQQTAT